MYHKAIGNMKGWYFYFFILTYYGSFCQEVEYYPSQSVLDTFHKVHVKRNIKDDCSDMFHTDCIKNEIRTDTRKFNQPNNEDNIAVKKRAVDTVFHGYPKTREELWNEHFLDDTTAFDQTPSLVNLLHNITLTYLKDCTPVILYDNQVKSKESYLVQNLLKGFPMTFVHGYITDEDKVMEPELLQAGSECLHYIIFLTDVKKSAKVLGKQPESKVIVVARSSQWAVQEFLAQPVSRMFVNLLVIGQSFKEGDDAALVSLILKFDVIGPTIRIHNTIWIV